MFAFDSLQKTILKTDENSFEPLVTTLVTYMLTGGNRACNYEPCYFLDMRSIQDGIKKMLKDSKLSPEEAAEKIGMHRKSIYRWLRKSDTFQKPDRELLNKLADVCDYKITTIETDTEIYFLFTNKNKDTDLIEEDIQLLMRGLGSRRLDAIRNFMLLAPEFSEQTIDLISRFISDAATIEASRVSTKKNVG